MKNYKYLLVLVGFVAVTVLGAVTSVAQEGRRDRGDFNPEEFRQRMMDRMREQMDVENDAEWKIISTRIEAVMEARREAGGFGGGGPGFAFRGRGPGGPGGPGGDRADRGGRGGRGNREADPNVDALREALESDASADDIKAKMAKVREDRKAKQKELEAAQAELKKVLSVKQEANAFLMGLLP